jgi:hypothetical protein
MSVFVPSNYYAAYTAAAEQQQQQGALTSSMMTDSGENLGGFGSRKPFVF